MEGVLDLVWLCGTGLGMMKPTRQAGIRQCDVTCNLTAGMREDAGCAVGGFGNFMVV